MNDRTIIVTGASRRLGLYLVEKFLANQWQVIAVTRKASVELTKIVNPQLRFFEIESYSSVSLAKLINELNAQCVRLDALVHNASLFEADEKHLEDTESYYRRLFEIHMSMPAQLNQGLKNLLSQSKGNIIHITDIYAENPQADYTYYCSTKAGMENLNKSFAKLFAPDVRVNAIQPGPIQFLNEHSESQKKQIISETLTHTEGGFYPIYQSIMSIIENQYITGASIKVDGGRSLGNW